jgi:hypothetical protein
MKTFLLALVASTAFAQGLPFPGITVSVAPSTVATPTDSPGAGTYSSTQTVTLSDATSLAVICYTTDGGTPTATVAGVCDAVGNEATYTIGFSVAATTTVKAIGTKAAMTNSGVLTSVYTINAPTPTFSPTAGAVSNPTTVTIASGACGSYIYWNTTGSPTAGDTHGTSASVTTAETIYAKVIGCPSYSDSAVGSAAYTIAAGAYTDNFSGSGVLGANWTTLTTAWTTAPTKASSKAYPGSAYTQSGALYSGGTFATSQYSQATVAGSDASHIGVCVNMTVGGNGYCMYGLELDKMTAGSNSAIGTSCTGTLATNDVMKLVNAAGVLTAYLNGSATTCVATDSTYTGGNPAIIFSADSPASTRALSTWSGQ